MVLLTKLLVIPYYFVIWVFYRITGIMLTIFKVNFLAKKPMTVKLEKEMLEDIDNECEGLGCNRTDFVIEALEDKLEGKRQGQEVIEDTKPQEITAKLIDEGSKEEPKATIELIPEPKITIKEIPQDNSNKPVVQFTNFNGKLLPVAKRFNI